LDHGAQSEQMNLSAANGLSSDQQRIFFIEAQM
jgi:hypothetical protein